MKMPLQPIIMKEEALRAMLRPRPATAHKGTFGHALLVCGSRGMAGAAILAARAALRSGVGKLTVHTAALNLPILQTAVPEAMVLPDECDHCVTLCSNLSPFSAVGIGPGLGRDERTASALQHYLTAADKPMVIDADALNLIAQHHLLPFVPEGSILTPHVGELERLAGRTLTADERLDEAVWLSSRHSLYVVLKGHPTAVCSPDAQVFLCPAGNAGMATAGSGDVLTGLITGLLAQGYTPLEAATLGVWLHATAGDYAADLLQQECMLAGDIIDHLPQAFKRLKQTI